MSSLPASSAVLQPINYNGQAYFCSQYFHQQRLAKSTDGAKYQRHGDFLRRLRAIPTYGDLVSRLDSVELHWRDVSASKDVLNTMCICFKPLCHLTGYRQLTLLNATAQAAFVQRLEDGTSLEMAINATATQPTFPRPGILLPADHAQGLLAVYCGGDSELGILSSRALQAILQRVAAQYPRADCGRLSCKRSIRVEEKRHA